MRLRHGSEVKRYGFGSWEGHFKPALFILKKNNKKKIDFSTIVFSDTFNLFLIVPKHFQ